MDYIRFEAKVEQQVIERLKEQEPGRTFQERKNYLAERQEDEKTFIHAQTTFAGAMGCSGQRVDSEGYCID